MDKQDITAKVVVEVSLFLGPRLLRNQFAIEKEGSSGK
jgi:hypothetical protein